MGGRPANDICGWTYHPEAAISSAMVKTSQLPSVSSVTSVESGRTARSRPSIRSIPATSRSTPSNVRAERSAYPSSPMVWTTAQAAASGPPDLVDCMVELSMV